MKFSFASFLLFCSLLCGGAYHLHAQIQTPTVSAAALAYGQYADIPVNSHTGTGNISVPLHTVTEGPLALPISLQYHTAGLLVNSPASNVGLGWNLNAGGMISRSVKGLRDDDYDDGYYWHGDQIRVPGSNQNHSSWGKDSEPDLFTYNFPGGTGKFFIDANREVQMVPRSDIKIEPIMSGGTLDRFIATTPDGTKYYFGRTTSADGHSGVAKDYVALNEHIDLNEHCTGWFLLLIKSADDLSKIVLNYTSSHYAYDSHKPCPEEFVYRKPGHNQTEHVPVGCNELIFAQENFYFVQSQTVTSISTGTSLNQVRFNHGNRNDLNGTSSTFNPKSVTGLEVENGDFCVFFDFEQSYFNDNLTDTKLKLDKVTKRSCDLSLSEPAWEFDYRGPVATNGQKFFPATDNHDIDHWGYYNLDASVGPNDPNQDLTPPTTMMLGNQAKTYGTANRETNENSMKIGILERVTYPTGGHLQLSYEANRYREATYEISDFSRTAHGLNDDCDYTPYTTVGTFTYSAAMANAYKPFWKLCVEESPFCPVYTGDGSVEILDANNNFVAEVSYNSGPGAEQCLRGDMPIIGYGNTALQVGQTYTVRVTGTHARAAFTIGHESDPTEALCGGLRIAQTRVYDGLHHANDIIQNYEYGLADYPNVSSGVLHRTPQYGYRINSRTAVFTSLSMAPLSNFDGYHIGYERVTIDKNGLGEEVMLFHTDVESAPDNSYPVEPPTYMVADGQLDQSIAYSEGGQVVRESQITRNSTDYYEEFGGSVSSGYIFTQREIPYYVSGNDHTYRKVYNRYNLRTNIFRPSTVSSTVDGLTTTTTYGYQSDNLLAREVETTNSNGDVFRTVSTHAPDYPNSTVAQRLIALNMVHLPYLVEKYHNGTKVDGSLVDYRFYTSLGKSPSTSTSGRLAVPRLYRARRYEKTWNASGSLTGPGWQTSRTISEYQFQGLVHKYAEEGWLTTTIDYTQDRKLWKKTFNGQTQTFDYFPNNSSLLSQVTAVDGTTTSYTYDELGRLATSTDDCQNITTTYDYRFGWGGQNINYVGTTTDYPASDARSALSSVRHRQYKDGLGRNTVSVTREGGAEANEDVIVGVEYDKYGRVYKSYAPYSVPNNYGNYRAADLGSDVTLTTFESSPLSRKLSVTPPNWAATYFSYGVNTAADQVEQDGNNGFYPAGSLLRQAFVDANGNQSISFTDKIGQTVLSRRTNSSDQTSKRHDTYYRYDGKNRLSTVIPPGASASSQDLIYTYLYDGNDNKIETKIPGKDRVEYRYDTRDLPAAYRDGNLRTAGKWYVSTLDPFGRTTGEGFYNTTPPSTITVIYPNEVLLTTTYGTGHEANKVKNSQQKILDGQSNWLITTNTYSACGLLESQTGNNHLPQGLTPSETTTYDYDGANNLTASTYTHQGPANQHTILAQHHYDHAGRNVENHFKVDAEPGRQLNQLAYDGKGQLTTRYQGSTLHNGNPTFLQKIDYSYLANGMLRGINLDGNNPLPGSQTALPNFYQTGTTPNLGLVSGNDADDRDLFQLELYRDQKAPYTNFPARQNGDITAVATQIRGRQQQVWSMQYDAYDRMTAADFYERASRNGAATNANKFGVDVSYDKLGNIKTLERRGMTVSGSGQYGFVNIDDLTYTYPVNGSYQTKDNRLTRITDVSGSAEGYNNTNVGSYTYDDNGNTTYDPSRGVTIAYNHLDLPVTITWADGRRLVMVYDAAGTLLKRSAYPASGNTPLSVRDYVGGIEYVDGQLRSVYHEEGRVAIDGNSQQWQYNLTDHLGNTRLTYADDGDGVIDKATEIVQENHYYPFGLKMTGPWMGADNSEAYQYNGIDYVEEHDLGVNMAMYRTLDPAAGRWWSVDPKAESFTDLSPYNSMGNSPMTFADPLGDEPITVALGIATALGAFNGYQIGKAQGATGVGLFGYAFGGAAIGFASAGVGSAITTGVGGAVAGQFGGLIGSAVGGAAGGAFAGGGFSALAGKNSIDGLWKGAVSGFVGGGLGAYVGGGAGSFVGGFTGSSINSALHGADLNSSLRSGLIGGATALGAHHLTTFLNYQSLPQKSWLSYRQFRAMSTAAQRSFARGKEFGGWLLEDGGVEMWKPGTRSSITPTPVPDNVLMSFHTHPNAGVYRKTGLPWNPDFSTPDIDFNIRHNVSEWVISRQSFYSHSPPLRNTFNLGSNGVFNPYKYSPLWW